MINVIRTFYLLKSYFELKKSFVNRLGKGIKDTKIKDTKENHLFDWLCRKFKTKIT